jgi:hypothetical protein
MHHISLAVERPQRFLIPLHCLRLYVAFAAYNQINGASPGAVPAQLAHRLTPSAAAISRLNSVFQLQLFSEY